MAGPLSTWMGDYEQVIVKHHRMKPAI